MTVTFPLVAIVGLVVFIAYRYMGLRVWHALVSLIFGFLLAATSVAPEIQYQAIGVRACQPNTSSRGTGMPAGPPVRRASLVNTIAIRMPRPSVATAR